jgi:hypothetical protein
MFLHGNIDHHSDRTQPKHYIVLFSPIQIFPHPSSSALHVLLWEQQFYVQVNSDLLYHRQARIVLKSTQHNHRRFQSIHICGLNQLVQSRERRVNHIQNCKCPTEEKQWEKQREKQREKQWEMQREKQ